MFARDAEARQIARSLRVSTKSVCLWLPGGPGLREWPAGAACHRVKLGHGQLVSRRCGQHVAELVVPPGGSVDLLASAGDVGRPLASETRVRTQGLPLARPAGRTVSVGGVTDARRP
jgi:hypothetical protein